MRLWFRDFSVEVLQAQKIQIIGAPVMSQTLTSEVVQSYGNIPSNTRQSTVNSYYSLV